MREHRASRVIKIQDYYIYTSNVNTTISHRLYISKVMGDSIPKKHPRYILTNPKTLHENNIQTASPDRYPQSTPKNKNPPQEPPFSSVVVVASETKPESGPYSSSESCGSVRASTKHQPSPVQPSPAQTGEKRTCSMERKLTDDGQYIPLALRYRPALFLERGVSGSINIRRRLFYEQASITSAGGRSILRDR